MYVTYIRFFNALTLRKSAASHDNCAAAWAASLPAPALNFFALWPLFPLYGSEPLPRRAPGQGEKNAP